MFRIAGNLILSILQNNVENDGNIVECLSADTIESIRAAHPGKTEKELHALPDASRSEVACLLTTSKQFGHCVPVRGTYRNAVSQCIGAQV